MSLFINFYISVIPSPSVEVVPTGIPIITETFTLTCNATVPDNVAGLAIVSVLWLYNGTETIGDNMTLIHNRESSATLKFSPVSLTQKGLYTCIATLSISGIPLQKNTVVDYDFHTLSKI